MNIEINKSHFYEILLCGKKISLKIKNTEEDPLFVEETLNLVQSRLEEIEKASSNKIRPSDPLSIQKVLLLTLFDLAEEYLRSKKKVLAYQQQIEIDVNQLVQLVESELLTKK